MNHLRICHEPLDIAEISNLVTASSCGAISLFVGTTRDTFKDKRVVSLEYEAYESMALKQMQAICEQIRINWPSIEHIAIYHRLGLVKVCEASVVIAASSPHRREAIETVQYAIDELKNKVPIWKKEIYADNQSSWKENNASGKFKKFDITMCSLEDAEPVSKDFVQISANEEEISRRIDCFVQKKREEIDFNNILDFTEKHPSVENENEDEDSTCARTNSVIIKQEFSKCHLKVRRVNNHIGPQTRPDYLQTLDKLRTNDSDKTEMPTLKKENTPSQNSNKENSKNDLANIFLDRLEGIEEYLNMPLVKIKNIQQRIKNIENRLLFLESISPEYKHFLEPKLINAIPNPPTNIAVNKGNSNFREPKTYSVDDIDNILASLVPPSSKVQSPSLSSA